MLSRPTNWPSVFLVVVSCFSLSFAQEETPPPSPAPPPEVPAIRPPDEPPPEEPPTPAPHRPLGPQLFPFYEHYVRQEDETTVRNILYLFQTTEGKDGSSSQLLLPFYYHSEQIEPQESRLHLYPLLYFRKSSEAESYNYSLPLVYDHRTPDTATQVVFPLWWHRATDGRKLSRHHVLFPFFRHTKDLREPERPLRTMRLGLWKVLELWESRRGPDTYDRKALTFFNWGDDALGGLSAYSASWVGKDESLRGSTYLFPFYWHSRSPGAQSRTLFPLYWEGSSPSGSHLWVVPFFGHWQGNDARQFWILPLLSGFGSGPGESKSFATIPLFLYASGPEHFGFGTLLGGYRRTRESSMLNVLLILYHSRHHFESGKRTHSVLYPLSHFDVEPDGINGTRWVVPYFETFNDASLWRVGFPLYLEHQTRTGGEMDSYWKFLLPLYYSWGEPDDYFSMGIPLYWASRDGPRGWQLFIPLFARSYNATSSGTHIPLVVSYRSFPSRKQLALGGPLYVHERRYDLDDQLSGQSHSLLWPFFKVGWGETGHEFRLLPVFWTSRDGEARDLLVGPFYWQSSPDGGHLHFFPVYGRYQSERVTRDYYGAGSYISSLHRDEAGNPAYSQQDFLWKLASFQQSLTADVSHQHLLPLALWRTRTPRHDRTVVGPLYYSHRTTDGDQEHSLKLVLGNLFLSKSTTKLVPISPADQAEPSAEAQSTPEAVAAESSELASADPAEESDTPEEEEDESSTGQSDESTGTSSLYPLAPTVERRVVEKESGILWPLSRSYYSADDEASTTWLLPFFYNHRDRFRSQRAIWPLYFAQRDNAAYDPSFFRYFYLYDHENWEGGYRRTIGQLLFDWKRDEKRNTRRWRFLYPLLEHERSDTGYKFAFAKPLLSLSASTDQGERIVDRHFFPFYWHGSRDREDADGEWTPVERHFFFLPLFGVHARTTRTDYFAFFPLFHLLRSREAINFELWPAIFSRNEPGLDAKRLWPLHANERGELAGDFWVSRYLFLSKYFGGPEKTTYRLDPFLFEYSRSEEEQRTNFLFHLFVNHRSGNDSWLHLFPLYFRGKEGETSFTSLAPLFYGKNFGSESIDYLIPWRFVSIINHMRQQDGQRYSSLLWKLFEYTDSTTEENFYDVRFMHAIYRDRKTPTSRQFAVNPFFSYYRDEAQDETQLSFLLSLYSYRTVGGRREHTLFYFLRF